jgi:DNA repair exonuclease SbcCD ATPase subunit
MNKLPIYNAWNADRERIKELEQQLANSVQALSDQAFEYNRKTNALIKRHSEQLTRATGMPYATEGARAVALEKALDDKTKQLIAKNEQLANYKAESEELRKQIVMLREALEYFSPFDEMFEKAAIEALAATADLKDCILCDAEPAGWNDDALIGYPLYRARKT